MKNYKRFIVPVFVCAVLFIGAGAAFFYIKEQITLKPDQFIQEKANFLQLFENSSEIHRLWTEGEESRE